MNVSCDNNDIETDGDREFANFPFKWQPPRQTTPKVYRIVGTLQVAEAAQRARCSAPPKQPDVFHRWRNHPLRRVTSSQSLPYTHHSFFACPLQAKRAGVLIITVDNWLRMNR